MSAEENGEKHPKRQEDLQGTDQEGSQEESHKKRKVDYRSPVEQFLDSVQLRELCEADQQILLMEHNWSVARALKEMADHHILSAPLVASPDLEDLEELAYGEERDMTESFIGWIDMHDLLQAFFRHLEQELETVPTKMLQLMAALQKEAPAFEDKMLITVMGGKDKELVYQANATTSLLFAMRDYFLGSEGRTSTDSGSPQVTHRIATFDAHGRIQNIISQLDVIKYLLEHVGQLGDLPGKSIAQAGLLTGRPPVLTIDPHLPTLVAFRRMHEAGVSGAPVVTPKGELIANLSVSDLRCLQGEHLSALALPVAEFLALLHGTTYVGYSIQSSSSAEHPFFASADRKRPGDVQLITCQADSTVHEVLRLLVENHIHRVYVVENNEKEHVHVVGVVTPTDIMRLACGMY